MTNENQKVEEKKTTQKISSFMQVTQRNARVLALINLIRFISDQYNTQMKTKIKFIHSSDSCEYLYILWEMVSGKKFVLSLIILFGICYLSEGFDISIVRSQNN